MSDLKVGARVQVSDRSRNGSSGVLVERLARHTWAVIFDDYPGELAYHKDDIKLIASSPSFEDGINWLESNGKPGIAAELQGAFNPEPPVQLELTKAEAETLMLIVSAIGGHPEKTRRGYADSIRRKLDSADVNTIGYSSEFARGEIYFTA